MPVPLIEFIDIYKGFDNNKVLKGVTFNIYSGQITSIIGKSGIGKSVLLKHIIGLMIPDRGDILFQGKSIRKMKKSELSKLKNKISYMFQSAALFDSMTVIENISLPLIEKSKFSKSKIKQKVRERMNQLDLYGIDNKYPAQLSGGMKKRVALARALVTGPEIILFDEPTTGLDPIRKNSVHSMISDYQTRLGFTAILVSHEIPDVFYISQRIVMLDAGKIIFQGSYREILRSKDQQVLDFITGSQKKPDGMTGLVGHSIGNKRIYEEKERLGRHGIPFSLIMFTVRNFDEINDRFGFTAGQTALKHISVQVEKYLRINDCSCRNSKDSVLLILSHTNIEDAKKVFSKLVKIFADSGTKNILPDYSFCLEMSGKVIEINSEMVINEIIEGNAGWENMDSQFNLCYERG